MNTELLVEHVAAYLETDPRFVNEREGAFTFGETRVFFTMHLFYVELEFDGMTMEVELH